ncbi:MAG: hypothetical protein Kow006_17390 [Gammaproteobacteria bacterium]
MKWQALWVAGVLSVVSAVAHANSLTVGLSGDAARFEFQTMHSGLGLSNANTTYSIVYNDDSDWILGGRVEVFGAAAAPGQGLHAGAGVGALYGDIDDDDLLAIALTGNLRYVFPEANRFAVSGQLLLAPEITSFMDSEGYVDWSVQGEYELTREAHLFFGYRDIEVDVERGPDVDFESGFYAGVSIRF